MFPRCRKTKFANNLYVQERTLTCVVTTKSGDGLDKQSGFSIAPVAQQNCSVARERVKRVIGIGTLAILLQPQSKPCVFKICGTNNYAV